MKLFGPGLCFPRSPTAAATNDPLKDWSKNGKLFAQKSQRLRCFSLYCMQTTGKWCQVKRLKESACSSKLYCSAPCTIELRGWAERGKIKVLHLASNFKFNCKLAQIMTCGESRVVFTVINALCNSLKTIKEAEVFFLFFFLFSSCGSTDTFPGISTVHTHTVVFHYAVASWTVVGISGRQFTQ